MLPCDWREKREQADTKVENKARCSGRRSPRKRETGCRGLCQCASLWTGAEGRWKIDVEPKEGTLKRNTESATVISTSKHNLGKVFDFFKHKDIANSK